MRLGRLGHDHDEGPAALSEGRPAGRPSRTRDRIPYAPAMVWEFVFMMVILKIPIVYLCLVVYWAVKAEPKPPEPEQLLVEPLDLDPRPPWRRQPRVPRRGPHGSPIRVRRAVVRR